MCKELSSSIKGHRCLHCLKQYVTMCHWAVRLKTTGTGKPSLWQPVSSPQKTRLSCTAPTHTRKHTHSQCKLNSHIHNASISYALYTNTTTSAAACDQTSLWSSRAVPPWRSLTGSFPRLSCNSEHQASHSDWAGWNNCEYNRSQSRTAVTKKLYQQQHDRSSLRCLAL